MLNEKGLAEAMKAAYRGGGYTVAESQGKIMINTEYVAVRYETKQLPRKCLGLIAEHIGELPFRCRTRKGHCCCVDCGQRNGCEARCLNSPDRCGQYCDPATAEEDRL